MDILVKPVGATDATCPRFCRRFYPILPPW